jgi:hypothetical protein
VSREERDDAVDEGRRLQQLLELAAYQHDLRRGGEGD